MRRTLHAMSPRGRNRLELEKKTAEGRGGNGASVRPASSDSGRFVAFDSTALAGSVAGAVPHEIAIITL